MKKIPFDTQLITAAPADSASDHDFTDKVMQNINTTNKATTHSPRYKASPRGSFIARLSYMPKFAIFVLAVASLTLFGGTTYALYKILWTQPTITTQTPTTNQFGRTQVAVSVENCANQKTETAFEIKSGSTLNPGEISKILQARCELEVIRDWVGENIPHDNAGRMPTEGTSQLSTTMVYPVASKVESISDTKLVLTGNQDMAAKTLTLSNDTQYIANNSLTMQDAIQPGDSVIYVQDIITEQVTKKDSAGHYNATGTPISRTITYVIKADLPFEYYNPSKQNQISQRKECVGNAQDSCIQTQLVDLYSPSAADVKSAGEAQLIQGLLIGHTGNTIKIKSSSGRIFTLSTSSDVIEEFNNTKSANYNELKVGVGDLLQVNYITSNDEAELTLDNAQIVSIQLALSMINKLDSVQKY